ncbi:MAG: hypothetical protein ACE5ID_03290, partial [Acidobacteriota bacterium]
MRRPLRLLAIIVLFLPGVPMAAVPPESSDVSVAPAVNPPDTPASGSIHFSSHGIVHRITAGRRADFLSVTMEVENRSAHPLEIRPIDLWAVAGSGTVLSEPDLRQDGLGVDVATIQSGQTSVVELSFLLGPASPFQRFTLHWGGRLREQSLTGEVDFVEGKDGFEPVSDQERGEAVQVAEGEGGSLENPQDDLSQETQVDQAEGYGESEQDEFEDSDDEDRHHRYRSYSS